jgi:hypothetical protein
MIKKKNHALKLKYKIINLLLEKTLSFQTSKQDKSPLDKKNEGTGDRALNLISLKVVRMRGLTGIHLIRESLSV